MTICRDNYRINVPFYVNVYDKVYGNGEYHIGAKYPDRQEIAPLRIGRLIYRIRVIPK